jgi:hypothetical protein
MITVFKTNVQKAMQAKKLVSYLLQHFPGSKINIDLKDCDKVLRVEGDHLKEKKIMLLVKETGFSCALL